MTGQFSIIWHRRRLEWRHNGDRAPWALDCFLTECMILAGQPRLQITARLGSILEDRQADLGEVDRFWHAARKKLGKLGRLRDRQEGAAAGACAAINTNLRKV